MNDEFDALDLVRDYTWTLVPTNHAHNVIDYKWIFKIKQKPDGSIEWYKARHKAKGFHQWPGIDFHATFSQVAKPTTIRVILTLVVTHNWTLRQLDVNNSFL